MLIRIRRSKDLLLQFQSFECSSLFASNSCVYCTTRFNKCGRIGKKWLFFFTFIEECCVVIEKNIDKELVNRISYQIWYRRYLKGKFGRGGGVQICEGGVHIRCDTGLPVYQSLQALVGLNTFIILSSVMTCIKCRLSSSLFFLWLTQVSQRQAAELISGALPDNSYSWTRGLPFRQSQKQHQEIVFDPPFSRFLKCSICLYNCVRNSWKGAGGGGIEEQPFSRVTI